MIPGIGGKPAIIKNPKELLEKINAYFNNCPDTRKIITKNGEILEIPAPTICGLALYLGFASRQSFYDYGKDERYSYIINCARLFIEKEYEQLLRESSCTGAIFALKNMGWVDRTEVEQTNINKEPLKVEIIE